MNVIEYTNINYAHVSFQGMITTMELRLTGQEALA